MPPHPIQQRIFLQFVREGSLRDLILEFLRILILLYMVKRIQCMGKLRLCFMWLQFAFHQLSYSFFFETLIHIEMNFQVVDGSDLCVFIGSFLYGTSKITHCLDCSRGNQNKTKRYRVLTHSTKAKPQNDSRNLRK